MGEANNYTETDGTVDGTDNVMIALEHVCVDDRKSEGNGGIKDNNDDYNDDDGGGGGSVVGNNNANLVTIPMRTLIDMSGEKEEENKSRDIAQIDVEGALSEAINRYSVISNNNANLVTIPMSALIDLSKEKE